VGDLAVLVPRTHVRLPDSEPLRTRRYLSGVLAHGLTAAPVHALLTRGRTCVVHTVEGPLQSWDSTTSIPAWAAGAIDVRVPLGDRAEWLGLAITYRAEAQGAVFALRPQVSVELLDAAGLAVIDGPVVVPLTGTARLAGWLYVFDVAVATTTDRRDPALVVGRPLRVPVASAGDTLVVRLTPTTAPAPRVQICSVTIYELPSDAEAP
jgi:hypothetical protein